MNGKIYEFANPSWLADNFVFYLHEDGRLRWIKVNSYYRIEELGSDITDRLIGMKTNDELLTHRHCHECTDPKRIALIQSIDEEQFKSTDSMWKKLDDLSEIVRKWTQYQRSLRR